MNKTMKSLLVALTLVMGYGLVSHAASIPRSPKETHVHAYSTTATLVHSGPGAVYQVVLGTGAAGEYAVLVDSGSATGVDAPSTSKLIAPRLMYSSTTANTIIPFDPPLMYSNGLVVDGSAATGIAAITYESGRPLSGN